MALGAARLLAFRFQWNARLRCAAEVSDAGIQGVIDRHSDALSLYCVPMAVWSSEGAEPRLVTGQPPVLVLPNDIKSKLTLSEISDVIAYLLGHVGRFDHLVVPLIECIAVLLFFNPMVWFARRRWKRERVFASDDVAAALADSPTQYARTLRKLAEARKASHGVVGQQ